MLVVQLDGGDSYKLSVGEAETFLRLLGESEPDAVTMLVWNFYAVHYTVPTHRALVVPVSSVQEVLEVTY